VEPFLGKTTLLLFCPSFTLEDWWLKSLWEKLQLDSQDHQLQKLWREENNMVSPKNTEQLLGVSGRAFIVATLLCTCLCLCCL